jgi:acetate kinase
VHVLVVNAGSSSLKLALVQEGARSEGTALPPGDLEGLRRFATAHRLAVGAVGHRVVHGGRRFGAPVTLDDAILAELAEVRDLAPLHDTMALEAIAAARGALPDVPQVACFDTAFHGSLPPCAATYAVPRQWREEWGIHRYGFHGLSHAWVDRRAAALAPSARRIVSCHLGAGASLAAIRDGRSVDTTTRAGSVDHGALTWAMRHNRLDADALDDALIRRSGLLGLSGTSDRMEVLEAGAAQRDVRARLAIDVYLHRLRGQVASMAAALGGIDALAFTGGVGEHSAGVRAATCHGLAFLGIELDDRRNDGRGSGEGNRTLSPPGAQVAVLLVRAREDLEIAREVEATCVPAAAKRMEPPRASPQP